MDAHHRTFLLFHVAFAAAADVDLQLTSKKLSVLRYYFFRLTPEARYFFRLQNTNLKSNVRITVYLGTFRKLSFLRP